MIEANPAWGAGIYGCEPGGALQAIARGCRRLAGLSPADERWVIERTTGGVTS